MSKKKKTRRSIDEYPELEKKFALKSRSDLLDQDYTDKLSPKEKRWLNKFNKEYVSASMDEDPKKNLHKTKKLRKKCYDSNNARNRCELTRAKASNQLNDYEELYETSSNNDYEDFIIEKLDQKDIIQAVEWLATELSKDEDALEEKLIDEVRGDLPLKK